MCAVLDTRRVESCQADSPGQWINCRQLLIKKLDIKSYYVELKTILTDFVPLYFPVFNVIYSPEIKIQPHIHNN